MDDLNCPYCNKAMDTLDDQSDPGRLHERQCPYCGKHFVFEIEYAPIYTSRKADCLNGAEHDFVMTRTFPPEFARAECMTCRETAPDKGPQP